MLGNQAVIAGQLGFDPRPILILVDSGASDSYLDENFAKARRLDIKPLAAPRDLLLFDGQPSSAGKLKEFVRESLRIGDYSRKVEFNLTRLTGVDIVLGFQWLKENEAVVDFGRRRLVLPSQGGAEKSNAEFSTTSFTPTVKSSNLSIVVEPPQTKHTPSLVSSSQDLASPTLLPRVQDHAHVTPSPMNQAHAHAQGINDHSPSKSHATARDTPSSSTGKQPQAPAVLAISSKSSTSTEVPMPRPRITSAVNAIELPEPKWNGVGSARLCAVLDSSGVEGELEDFPYLPDFTRDGLTQVEVDELKSIIPVHYHRYLDLFNPREALETLPPHREYDMTIQIKPESKLPIAPLYQLSPKQMEVMKEVLDREKKAGRIRASNSSYGSPTFFAIRPSDNKYRMVVDY